MTPQLHQFPSDITGLPEALPPERVQLADGDELELRIAPVAKSWGSSTVRMLAYNGSIPGPTLWVREGSELIVHAQNDGDLEATVHWHGLRLENRFDGTAETQAPMPIGGGRFTYRLQFPDPGVYWYHPHIREDYGQEMGLYGNIVVVPSDPTYWPPAHRELTLTLDDVLLEEGRVAPFSPEESNYTAMGRFGNVLLAQGETEVSLSARRGEVVRFYLTNTANSRVFKAAFRGARMKRVGGDSGRVEQEEFVDGVIIAPSERTVVDVLFDRPGRGLARASHARPHVQPGYDPRTGGASRAVARGTIRAAAHELGHGCRAGAHPRSARCRTGQDAGARGRDESGRTGRRSQRRARVRLPDAPRGQE
jgi:FtsP/CotA-like multicopper oxidase with cupredoxin domain